MVAHVTAMWLCAEAWHRAPASQPAPGKGDVCVDLVEVTCSRCQNADGNV